MGELRGEGCHTAGKRFSNGPKRGGGDKEKKQLHLPRNRITEKEDSNEAGTGQEKKKKRARIYLLKTRIMNGLFSVAGQKKAGRGYRETLRPEGNLLSEEDGENCIIIQAKKTQPERKGVGNAFTNRGKKKGGFYRNISQKGGTQKEEFTSP